MEREAEEVEVKDENQSPGKKQKCNEPEEDHQSDLPLDVGSFFYPLQPTAFVVSDALQPDFPVIYVNSMFEIYTGYRAEEVLGQNCRFLQYKDPHAQTQIPVDPVVLSEIRRCLKEGVEFQGEILNFRKDGTLMANRLQLRPIHGDDGIVTQIIGIQAFSESKIDINRVMQLTNLTGQTRPTLS